ncbi:MAG: hypothetical protein AAB250_00225 [Bdellovibrionota bacterium]
MTSFGKTLLALSLLIGFAQAAHAGEDPNDYVIATCKISPAISKTLFKQGVEAQAQEGKSLLLPLQCNFEKFEIGYIIEVDAKFKAEVLKLAGRARKATVILNREKYPQTDAVYFKVARPGASE